MKVVRGFLAVMFFVGLALAVLPPGSTAEGCHVGDFDNNCVTVSATSLVGPGGGYDTLVSPTLPYLIHNWAPGETQYSYSISTRWQKLVSAGGWDSINRPKQGQTYKDCPAGYTVDPNNYKKCVKWVDPVYSYKNETITGKVYKPTDCTPPPDKKITICHVAGRADDPANYNTLTISVNAVYGPGGHFNENGTPQAGHENDSFGECVPPPPPYVPCSVTVEVAGTWSDWVTDPTNALQEVRSQTITAMDSVNSTLVCGSRVVTETRSKECAVGQLINDAGECYTPEPTEYCSVAGETISVPYGQEPPAGATLGACEPPVDECLAPNTLVNGVCTPPVVVTEVPPPYVRPLEICGNGLDDNESGTIDENCVVAQVTGAEVPNNPLTKTAGLIMAGVGLIGFGLSFKKR